MYDKKTFIISSLIVLICGFIIIYLGIYSSQSQNDSNGLSTKVSKYVTLPEDIYHLEFENNKIYKVQEQELRTYIDEQLEPLEEDKTKIRRWNTMDDDYLQKNFQLSKDDYVIRCQQELQDQKYEIRDQDDMNYIFSYLVKESKCEIPDDMVDIRVKEQMDAIAEAATFDEFSVEEYIQNVLSVSSQERYEAFVRENMKVLIKQELTLRAVAEHYNLDLSEDGYQEMISKIMDMEGGADNELLVYYTSNGGTEQTRISYYKEEVLKRLLKDAKVTYTEE